MRQSMETPDLVEYVSRQMETFFPDGPVDRKALLRFAEEALARLEHCHSNIAWQYYRSEGMPIFDHQHTDHWAAYLYLLGNCINRGGGDIRTADKSYALNRALHGIDVYHSVELPPVFLFSHPVGTVIGKAKFDDFFAICQNCYIGGDQFDHMPTIGRGVVLYAGASVIGPCNIGGNCVVSPGAIVETDVPKGSMVYGQHPSITCTPISYQVESRIFGWESGTVLDTKISVGKPVPR
ncbi:Serine O-acetyltransferase [Rhodospirillaceae bacterium LM-1]|nr:Serine O-acetyltransferase [Rhodospirillaceae bacterium LM-1]